MCVGGGGLEQNHPYSDVCMYMRVLYFVLVQYSSSSPRCEMMLGQLRLDARRRW